MLGRLFAQALPQSPEAMHEFTQIGRAAEALIKQHGDAVEFEVRLGNTASGHFDPGVSVRLHQRALELLNESQQWVGDGKAVQVEDAYYNANEQTVRSRSYFRDEGQLTTEQIIKSSFGKWTYKVPNHNGSFPESENPAIRIALNVERPVPPPDGVYPTTRYVISHLRTWRYAPTGYEGFMMQLDLKESWEETDRGKAELLQRTVPGKCTLEVEVTDNSLFKHKFGSAYTVLSTFMKSLDFIRYRGEAHKPIELEALRIVSK